MDFSQSPQRAALPRLQYFLDMHEKPTSQQERHRLRPETLAPNPSLHRDKCVALTVGFCHNGSDFDAFPAVILDRCAFPGLGLSVVRSTLERRAGPSRLSSLNTRTGMDRSLGTSLGQVQKGSRNAARILALAIDSHRRSRCPASRGGDGTRASLAPVTRRGRPGETRSATLSFYAVAAQPSSKARRPNSFLPPRSVWAQPPGAVHLARSTPRQ